MKQRSLLIIVIVCVFFNANAQNIKPLKIGDSIPETVWNMPIHVINHPQGRKTVTLGAYRDKKLIILDFWATWCSPCVASLDKLVPIYRKLSADLMLLPVASHDLSSNPMAGNLIKKKKWGMSVFDQDQFLFKLFGGRGIPYEIWIKDNKILAIPETGYATAENIQKAIHGLQFTMGMDTAVFQPLDFKKPLFVKNNGETGLYFKNKPYAVISRYLPGYGTGRKTEFLRVGDTSIVVAINRKLQDLLFDAYHEQIFPGLDAKTGTVWNISDSLKTRLFNGPKYDETHLLANDLAWKDWLTKNTYGYNLRFPQYITETLAYNYMQQDIGKLFALYLNLSFKIESSVKHRYAVLELIGSREKSIALLKHDTGKSGTEQVKDSVRYYNQHYQQVFLGLLSNSLIGLTIPTVIDSTGISPNLRVDFTMPKKIPDDLISLNRGLKPYGLILIIKDEFVPVLVVTEGKSDSKINNQ